MLEAVVGVALRAVLASVVFGGALALCVLVATRRLALTASTRHALWTTALIAMGVMPLAGIGVSLARAEFVVENPSATPVSHVRANPGSRLPNGTLARSPHAHGAHATNAAVAVTGATQTEGAMRRSVAVVPGARAAKVTPWTIARIASMRDATARWTPRVSHTLALGGLTAWALGALIGLLGLAASIARVRGLKRRSSPLDGALADELPWLTDAGHGREIYVRLSYETETPVAIGFRRPVILVPTELATADGLTAIEALILHEHAHLCRYDDWTNLVQRVIERVFWFNPILWIVGRRIALEREIASDDAVVEKTGAAHEYATSLWRLAREMRMPEHSVVAPGALLTRKQISVRIERLLDTKRARLHRSPAAAFAVSIAALLAVGAVATSAPAVELPAPAAPLAATQAAPFDAALRLAVFGDPTLLPSVDPAARVTADAAARGRRSASHDGAASHTTSRTPWATGASGAQHVARGVRPEAHGGVYERILVTTNVPPATSLAGRTAHAAASAAPAATRASHAAETTAAQPATVAAAPAEFAPPPLPSLPAPPPSTLKRVIAFALPQPGANVREIAQLHPHLGREIQRVLRDALAALPAQMEHARSGMPRRDARYDGMAISRALVASCAGCSMRNADLHGVDLHGLRISAVDLSGADMRNVNLAGARLAGVSLAGANLSGADLRGARFLEVDLAGTNFNGADLSDARFNDCNLGGASPNGADTAGMTTTAGSGLDG